MKLIVIVLLSVFFVACNSNSVAEVESASSSAFKPYIVNVKSERKKTIGEKDRCMSGVCLDKEYNFSNIGNFERKSGINNDVYVSRISSNDDFSSAFLLECAAQNKIPMIILDKNVTKIQNIAKECKNISPFMFIALDYENDVALYNKNAAIIKKEAPSIAVMWDIDYDSDLFVMPEKVDWVLINFSEKIENGVIDSKISELRKAINYFGNYCVALNVSIENFSSEDHKYYIDLWQNEVKSVYSLSNDYENIGLINYVSDSDVNKSYGSSDISNSNDLSLCLKNVTDTLNPNRRWKSTDVVAYLSDGTAYIDYKEAIKLGFSGKYVNNKFMALKYYDLDDTKQKIFINKDNEILS